MKAAHKIAQNRTFTPKPLSIEQQNAVDLLLTGKADREVAEAVGVRREAVAGWRTRHPLFIATLHQRREALFAGALDRLRGLMSKAIDNIQVAIDSGDATMSFQLLKAVGLHGYAPPTGEVDPQKLFESQVKSLADDGRGRYDELIDKLDPGKWQREAEIRAKLIEEYGTDDA